MATYLSSSEREAITRNRLNGRARKSASTLFGYAPATPGHRGLGDHHLYGGSADQPASPSAQAQSGAGLGLGLSLGADVNYGSVTLHPGYYDTQLAESSCSPLYDEYFPHHSPFPPSPKLSRVSLPDVSRTCTPRSSLGGGHAAFVPAPSGLRSSLGEMVHDDAIGIMVPVSSHEPPSSHSALGIYQVYDDPAFDTKRRREDIEDVEARDFKRARGAADCWLPPYHPGVTLPPAQWPPQQQGWRVGSALTPPYTDGMKAEYGSPERKLSSSSSSSSPSDYFSHASQTSHGSTTFPLLTPHETPLSLPKQELSAEQQQQQRSPQHASSAKESAANARAGFDKPDKSIRLLSQALKDKLITRELAGDGSASDDEEESMVTPTNEHVSALRTIIPAAMTSVPLRHPSMSTSSESAADDKVIRDDFTLADVDASIILQCLARDESLIQKEKENPGSASHIGKFRDREEEKGVVPPPVTSQSEGKGKKNGALRSLQPGICHNCGIDEVSGLSRH